MNDSTAGQCSIKRRADRRERKSINDVEPLTTAEDVLPDFILLLARLDES